MTENRRGRFYELRDLYLTDMEAATVAVSTDRSLLEVRSGLGETVLHWLVVENAIYSVQSLISSGAVIDTVNDLGDTPLMDAASLGYQEMCRLLLTKGADPRYVSPQGESPLSRASRSRQLETLQILLSQFQATEELRSYFEDYTLEMILDIDDDVAKLLRNRRLSPS